jgi:hypothetical protein
MQTVLTAATILGGIAAIWFFWDKIVLWFGRWRIKEWDLVAFVREGQQLSARSSEIACQSRTTISGWSA